MSREILDGAIELFNQKKIDAALEKFEQCAADLTCRAAAYYGMGCCYSYKFDIYNAKDCFENVVGTAPGSPEAEVARAFIEDSKQWIAGEIDFFSLSTDIQRASPGSLCAYHEEAKEPAVYVCASCQKPVCLQCTFPVAAKYYCIECGRTKEIEQRREDSFSHKKSSSDKEPVQTKDVPYPNKTVLYLGIYVALLCVSLLYRYVLRDAAAKHAGLTVTGVSGAMIRERVDPSLPDSGDVRFSYGLKVKIKNAGTQTLWEIRLRVKLYDTFGQKIAQKDVDVDRLGKNRFNLSPGRSRTVNVKVTGLRGNVAQKRLYILSFRASKD